MAAAPWIVSDELWELVEPLLPRKDRLFRHPGRKLQAPAHPLRTPRRHAQCVAPGRLPPRLLSSTRELF
jgi:hypothetical protein